MTIQITFQPTLFICLGTSSGEIGWRLKKRLQQAYGDVPVLRHLWIDLDSYISPEEKPWYAANERVPLWGYSPAEVIHNLENFPAIREWWPETNNLRPGMLVGDGAPKQMRPVGRLSLFRMFNDRTYGPSLIEKLRSAADALFEIDNIRATKAMSTPGRTYNVEQKCRVYIIYTKCGGSGSSMPFDVAYLMRDLLRGKDPEIVSVGILPAVLDKAILSESQTQREKIRANCYAWFKEDNYLLENPYWNVQYPEGAPVEVNAPPFDTRYVIDIENQRGYRLNATSDVYNMVAQAIFMNTGAATAGNMRSYEQIKAVNAESFQGMRRAYSSLAAASLLYPKARLLRYCSARMGRVLLEDGLLGAPDEQQADASASTLLAQLRLRDADLLADLLGEAYIKMAYEGSILKSDEVSAAAAQLDAQENQNLAARRAMSARLDEAAQARLAVARQALDAGVAQLAVKKGARFATAVLERLLQPAPAGGVESGTLALEGLKSRLAQQGASEADLTQARKEYEKARAALKRLDDGLEDVLERAVAGGGWRKKLMLVKRDCLTALGRMNDLTLQLAAQRHAAGIYDQIAAQAASLKGLLEAAEAAAGRAGQELGAESERLTRRNDAESYGYEFEQEIDLDFDEAYRAMATQAGAGALFPAMIPAAAGTSTAAFGAWVAKSCAEDAAAYAGQFFEKTLEATSLLSTLEEQARKRGMEPPALIAEYLDRLVEYCHPFWRFYRDRGLSDLDGLSIIGVEDENSPLIPDSYRGQTQFAVKTTGFRDRIDVVRMQHGLPAFLIRGVDECKAVYERVRKNGSDPLHVLPGMETAPDVMPERGRRNREVFAAGIAFGYIVQSGSWYYYDAERGCRDHGIVPGRDMRLAQGRERAEEVFARREDWARAVDTGVESEVRQMGNAAAIQRLDEVIKTHRAAMARMTADDGLRRQYEKEIAALSALQRKWGKVD